MEKNPPMSSLLWSINPTGESKNTPASIYLTSINTHPHSGIYGGNVGYCGAGQGGYKQFTVHFCPVPYRFSFSKKKPNQREKSKIRK